MKRTAIFALAAAGALGVTAVVGGVGVSSGTPAQDQDVAQAGIDAFLAAQA